MRSVKRYNRLTQLPLGRVRPAGWLLEQLRRNKEGLGGHLPELEPRMIATPYTTRETEPRWGRERSAGWGAEISGNYYNGLVELAFTLDDAELKEKAAAWVETVLKNQRPDGYMGTYRDGDDFFDDYNAWGTACGMKAMLSYFSATGRRDVLDAVHRCMLWFCENWAGDKKTRYGGVSIVSVMSECYLHTGDERLLRFCEDYYDFLERHDLFDKSLSAYLAPRLFYNANHGAGYAEAICHPLEVYLMNGDPRYLAASENACKKAQNKVVQKTGGFTCETEYLAPIGKQSIWLPLAPRSKRNTAPLPCITSHSANCFIPRATPPMRTRWKKPCSTPARARVKRMKRPSPICTRPTRSLRPTAPPWRAASTRSMLLAYQRPVAPSCRCACCPSFCETLC